MISSREIIRVLICGFLMLPPLGHVAEPEPGRKADANQPIRSTPLVEPMTVELRGRLRCFEEEISRRYGIELPAAHQHTFGLVADDGGFYTILRTRFSEALFVDERLREKDLLIKARLFSEGRVIEVESLRTLQKGQVHELYYYCDVCEIKAVSPDPCFCCQGPMELVEKPLAPAR